MSAIDLHNLGTFNSVAEVWAAYPEGGHEGDYVFIGGVKIYWNKYSRQWGNSSIDNNETTSGISTGSIYVGTTLKVAVSPYAAGFNAHRDDWTVEVRYGDDDTLYQLFEKDDMIEGEDGEYYVIIDTTNLSGDVRAIVRADIPDDDLDNYPEQGADGIRKEVAVVHICRILNLN